MGKFLREADPTQCLMSEIILNQNKSDDITGRISVGIK